MPDTPALQWTTPDGAHNVEIERGANTHRAICRCGWHGPRRYRSTDTHPDGMGHLAQVTHE